MQTRDAAGPDPMYAHGDPFHALNGPGTLAQKLEAIHAYLLLDIPGLERVAVASYDPATDLLKTFVASSRPANRLLYYDAKLADSPSLCEILAVGRPRIVNDLSLFHRGLHAHTRRVEESGFRSSYTLPIWQAGAFWGFVFFNSLRAGDFTAERLPALDLYGHLLGSLVASELMALRILAAAVKTAHDMVHFRDRETGAHIERMARYARLIARRLAADGKHPFSDQDIERIFLFAPLHDLGKIALPDALLHKPGPLSEEERAGMREHCRRGLEMVDSLARNFGLQKLEGLDVLRAIAVQHHETLDGQGYPDGLRGDAIRKEARVAAVADIFDALTSARPYKAAWSNERAFAQLREWAPAKLDVDCVEALIDSADELPEIQARFRDPDAG